MIRKRLTDKESRQTYINNWKSIKNDFFKLETLQIYEDDEALLEFKQGRFEEAKKIMRGFLATDPAKPYEKIKKRNIKFRRVHIIELPLTIYMKLEIESYKISIEFGEEIFFILKEQADRINKSVKFQDFLMFDDSVVVTHNYNKAGEWQYSELIDDVDVIKNYVNLKEKLLSQALPMDQFLQKHVNK